MATAERKKLNFNRKTESSSVLHTEVGFSAPRYDAERLPQSGCVQLTQLALLERLIKPVVCLFEACGADSSTVLCCDAFFMSLTGAAGVLLFHMLH